MFPIVSPAPFQSGVFISYWDTTKAGSTNTKIVIPFVSTGTYNCVIQWGDGTSNIITAFNDPKLTHTYTVSGKYTVTIAGTCNGFTFANAGDKLKLLKISQWGNGFQLGNNGNYFQCGYGAL